MCLRIYLNGDGTGRGSHLSLFFVVMRGQSDALLKWPFNQKVKELDAASHCHFSYPPFRHKFQHYILPKIGDRLTLSCPPCIDFLLLFVRFGKYMDVNQT